MASQQSIANYIVEQLDGTGVTARKMFGEFGLFHDGKMVALICDNQLYVKPTTSAAPSLAIALKGSPIPTQSRTFLFRESAGRIRSG